MPEESSLSALDQVTQDFGPGLEATKVLYISSIILLLGMAKLHSFIEYLITSVSYTHLRAHETPEHLVCRSIL